MTLHPIDIVIIVLYLITVVSLGWLLSRRAGKDMESYFLGGRSLPWYIIGVSRGASGFDITGTMWFATMLFVYGVKGVYVLWIWPMFATIFRMMYLGVWIRRSKALTGAEWMRTRFGRRGGGDLAHLSVVIYAVVGVIGFLSYAFQGIGKFAAPFFPPEWGISPEGYATIILLVTAAYLITGGMYSVVMTESIHSATGWIVAALFGGYTAPNVLKWHWWRFNGYGFFAGMIAGVVAAIVIPLAFPGLGKLHAFPPILAISAIASVVVCLLTPPEDDEVLGSSYLQVRPWGFWRPVHEKLASAHPDLQRNKDFGDDMINCIVGIAWQTTIVLVPIYIVLRDFKALWISVLALLATSIFIKREFRVLSGWRATGSEGFGFS